jgi:hypothetical protein
MTDTDHTCEGIVKTMTEAAIKNLETGTKSNNPSAKKDLRLLKKALVQYEKDCATCKAKTGSDMTCQKAAIIKFMRQFPFIRDSIYPWKNYEWNYSNFIDNNYSAAATGSSSNNLSKNYDIFWKLFNAYFNDPNPAPHSEAGKKPGIGIDNRGNRRVFTGTDYPTYGCLGNNKISCDTTHKISYGTEQSPPTNSRFFKNNPLKGEASSSYFIKIGNCPRPDIMNRFKCDKMNFTWINDPGDTSELPPGKCYQPKYAYIDNTPGLNTTPSLDSPFPKGKRVKLQTRNRKLNGTYGKIVKNFWIRYKNTYKIKCNKDNKVRILKPGNIVKYDTGKHPTEKYPFTKGTVVKIKNMPYMYGLNDTTGTVTKYYAKASGGKYSIKSERNGRVLQVPPANIKSEGLKGLLPSVLNDTLSLTPDKLFKAFMGQDVPGHLTVQKCPTEAQLRKKSRREYFTNRKKNSIYSMFIILIIAFFLKISYM